MSSTSPEFETRTADDLEDTDIPEDLITDEERAYGEYDADTYYGSGSDR